MVFLRQLSYERSYQAYPLYHRPKVLNGIIELARQILDIEVEQSDYERDWRIIFVGVTLSVRTIHRRDWSR